MWASDAADSSVRRQRGARERDRATNNQSSFFCCPSFTKEKPGISLTFEMRRVQRREWIDQVVVGLLQEPMRSDGKGS